MLYLKWIFIISSTSVLLLLSACQSSDNSKSDSNEINLAYNVNDQAFTGHAIKYSSEYDLKKRLASGVFHQRTTKPVSALAECINNKLNQSSETFKPDDNGTYRLFVDVDVTQCFQTGSAQVVVKKASQSVYLGKVIKLDAELNQAVLSGLTYKKASAGLIKQNIYKSYTKVEGYFDDPRGKVDFVNTRKASVTDHSGNGPCVSQGLVNCKRQFLDILFANNRHIVSLERLISNDLLPSSSGLFFSDGYTAFKIDNWHGEVVYLQNSNMPSYSASTAAGRVSSGDLIETPEQQMLMQNTEQKHVDLRRLREMLN